MSEIVNTNELVIPFKQCGMTFKELCDKYLKSFQKKENKSFSKMEQEWRERLNEERQNVVEVYPCATKFYHLESLNFNDYVVRLPVVVNNKDDGNSSSIFVKRFRLLFNTVNFDPPNVKVVCFPDKSAILVEVPAPESRLSSIKLNRSRQPVAFARYFKVSPDVDLSKLEASMALDKLLLIEAPLVSEPYIEEFTSTEPDCQKSSSELEKAQNDDFEHENRCSSFIKFRSNVRDRPNPPNQLPLQLCSLSSKEKSANNTNKDCSKTKLNCQTSKETSPAKTTNDSDSTSKIPSESSSGGKEARVGVPIFRDEKYVRRMYLTVEIGSEFTRNDIIVKILKENRIQISAKHKVKDGGREDNTKFRMNYELGEKVDPFSLKAGLTKERKLVVTALSKDGLRGDAESKDDLEEDGELSINESKDESENNRHKILKNSQI